MRTYGHPGRLGCYSAGEPGGSLRRKARSRVLNASLDEFSAYVLTERMGDEHVFAGLCHASSAVPRDFINVFCQATILQQAAGAPAMTVANVRSAMCDLYDEGKSGTSRTLSPAGQIG